MNNFYLTILTSSLLALAACGGGSSSGSPTESDPTADDSTSDNSDTGGGSDVGSVTVSGNSYAINIDGQSYSANAIGTVNGQPLFNSSDFFTAKNGAKSDFVGAATINGGQTHVGMSGTPSAGASQNSTVTYSGRGSLLQNGSFSDSPMSIQVNYADSSFSGSGFDGNMTLTGQISGANATGTTSYSGAAGTVNGALYDSGNEFNGVYQGNNNDYAGVFVTQQ